MPGLDQRSGRIIAQRRRQCSSDVIAGQPYIGQLVIRHLDKNRNLSGAIGKLDFNPEQLEENARAFGDGVVRAKPASANGNDIRAVTLAAAMLPGVPLEAATYSKTTA